MKLIMALVMSCVSFSAAASDQLTDMLIQRDVIAWHLSQGDSRAQVCSMAESYFDVHCTDTGTEFVLTRGTVMGITYLLTVSM